MLFFYLMFISYVYLIARKRPRPAEVDNVFWRVKNFLLKKIKMWVLSHNLYHACVLFCSLIFPCLFDFPLCVGVCMQWRKALVNSVTAIWISAIGGPIGAVSNRWITVKVQILMAHRPAPTETKRNADVFPALTAKVSAIYTYSIYIHSIRLNHYHFDLCI